jgi:hypothetical protein
MLIKGKKHNRLSGLTNIYLYLLPVMTRGKHTVAKILIVLISLLFIDGGRSLILVSDNVQVLLKHDHLDDIEIPHQHHSINFNEEEKWLEHIRFDFSCLENISINFLSSLSTTSQGFSDSVWQPPKFV